MTEAEPLLPCWACGEGAWPCSASPPCALQLCCTSLAHPWHIPCPGSGAEQHWGSVGLQPLIFNWMICLAPGQGDQGWGKSGRGNAICHLDAELLLPLSSPTACIYSTGVLKGEYNKPLPLFVGSAPQGGITLWSKAVLSRKMPSLLLWDVTISFPFQSWKQKV